jgi:hypothetical protein
MEMNVKPKVINQTAMLLIAAGLVVALPFQSVDAQTPPLLPLTHCRPGHRAEEE